MKYLAIVIQHAEHFSGTIHDLPVMAIANTLEDLQRDLSEGIALWEAESTPPAQRAQKFADLPTDIQAAYAELNPIEVFLEPAPHVP